MRSHRQRQRRPLHTSTVAETTFVGSLLTEFLTTHPQVRLDVVASDAAVDIVAEGYDAGIQLGEVIDKDMIAVAVTGDLRLAVVGAPSYFAQRGVPKHPRDLVEHDCLNWHPTPNAPPYRWEFSEKGRGFAVAVPTHGVVAPFAKAVGRAGGATVHRRTADAPPPAPARARRRAHLTPAPS